MQHVGDGVHRLGTRRHNFYLIVEDGQATLIDAGCSGEWAQLLDALESLGMTLGSLEGVVVTHVHSDHFGLARRAADGGVDVRVHEDEETRALGRYRGRFSATTKDLPLWKPSAVWNLLPMLRAGVMKLRFLDEVATFADGDILDIPGRPQAIHTPGHTEGHTMFLLADKGILFTGDGLCTVQVLGSRRGPQMIESVFHLDEEQAWRSLDRIVDVEAELLLPGHGDPWRGSPAAAVADAVQRAGR